jgi:hypothetical protein
MSPSTIAARSLAKAIAVVVATAAFAAPTTQAKLTATDTYGSLDPWAYNLIHRSSASTPVITEHSVGQVHAARPRAQEVIGLDSWAKNVVRNSRTTIPLITEHSAGQNQPTAVRSSATATAPPAGAPNGFDWTDAGIGAGSTLGLALLTVAAMLALRRRRALAHVHP